MEIIRKVVDGIYYFIGKLKKKNYRNYAVLLSGAVVIAVVSLNTVGFAGSGKNKVHAGQAEGQAEGESKSAAAEDEPEIEKLQVGLKGIISSINCMEEYSLATLSVDIDNNYEEIIVGTSKIRRDLLNKANQEKNSSQLNGVGCCAQQAVRSNQMPSEDYYSLLQIVEAEATGGDLHSKILIANVVLNRVEDSRFPDKIYDVVWERKGGAAQFSPTADGRIHSVAITEETYDAVERALGGEDYSEGALFFVARSSAEAHNVKWFDENLESLFEYGGHEYYTFMN